MKENFLIALFFLMLLITLTSCNNEDNATASHGKLISSTGCKNNLSYSNTKISADSTCVSYSLNANTKQLTVMHLNSTFNCCPGKIDCKVSFKNDTILINEFSSDNSCKCVCNYDLNIAVYDIEPKKYILKINNNNITNNEVRFDLDLTKELAGFNCKTN